jgi:outer membrane immunogenic protein
MRAAVVFGIALLGLTQSAVAADPAEDMPYLRGSTYEAPTYKTYTRWSGFYVGGQLEYASGHFDYTRATRPLVAFALRELALEDTAHVSNWEILGRHDSGGSGFGAFAGYNWQFEDVVLGLEVNYSRNSFNSVAPVSPLSRVVPAANNVYNVSLTGSGNMHIVDYGVFKGRVGWAAGNFMPYITAGFALGRADYARAATIVGTETLPNGVVTPFSFSEREVRNDAFVAGWAIGGGIDWCLWRSLFLRGEVEYVNFGPIAGITSHLVAGRVGAGYKF